MNLAENLTQLLEESNITLTKLSRETDIPQSTLHGWLNGVPPRNIMQLKLIADFFGVSIDSLCFNSKDRSEGRLKEYLEQVNLGTYEVILRRAKK